MNGKVYRGRGAAVLVVSLALYLVGLSSYLISSGWQALGDMAGDVKISVTVVDSVKNSPVVMTQQLEKIEGVEKVEYIDSRRAEKELSELLSSDIVELLGSNALPATYLLTLKPSSATTSSIAGMEQQIRSLDWVEQLYYEEAFSQEIEKRGEILGEILGFVGYIVGAVALILTLLAVKLSIGSTLSCYNQRSYQKVRTEALSWAVISGVASGFVASGLLFFTVKASHLALSSSFNLSYSQLPMISAVLIISSTVVTLLASLVWLEVHKR